MGARLVSPCGGNTKRVFAGTNSTNGKDGFSGRVLVCLVMLRHSGTYATACPDWSLSHAGLPRDGVIRGLFQYGLLHFGQFFGSGTCLVFGVGTVVLGFSMFPLSFGAFALVLVGQDGLSRGRVVRYELAALPARVRVQRCAVTQVPVRVTYGSHSDPRGRGPLGCTGNPFPAHPKREVPEHLVAFAPDDVPGPVRAASNRSHGRWSCWASGRVGLAEFRSDGTVQPIIPAASPAWVAWTVAARAAGFTGLAHR